MTEKSVIKCGRCYRQCKQAITITDSDITIKDYVLSANNGVPCPPLMPMFMDVESDKHEGPIPSKEINVNTDGGFDVDKYPLRILEGYFKRYDNIDALNEGMPEKIQETNNKRRESLLKAIEILKQFYK